MQCSLAIRFWHLLVGVWDLEPAYNAEVCAQVSGIHCPGNGGKGL